MQVTNKHFDAVIIGAGPIGILNYKLLKNSGLQVCVIVEREQKEYKTNNNFKINQAHKAGGLYGKMPFWGNGHDTDIGKFMDLPQTSDFPDNAFNETEILNAAKKIELLGWPQIKNDINFKSYLTKKLVQQGFEPSEVQRGKLHGILDEKFDKEDFIYVKSGELNFLFEDEKNSKVSAVLLTKDICFTANYFLICAGGLGNLALINKIFADVKPNPISTVLGYGYSNHPKQITHTLVFSKPKYLGIIHMIGKKWKSLEVLDFKPDKYVVNRRRNLRISMRFRPVVLDSTIMSDKNFYMFNSLVYRIAIKLGWSSCVHVMTYFEMPQKRSNFVKIKLQQENVVELNIEHRFTSEEKNYIEKSVSQVTKIFQREGLFVRVIEHQISFEDLEQNDASHYFGTTRMHDNPIHGVVDGNSLVHGTENLYCCGTSVLPLSAPNHPTWFAAILAVKACESIAVKHLRSMK